MTRKQSKQKQPKREDKQVKGENKIAERVLDDKTVEVLVSLLNGHAIDSLDYPVAGGKEAIVYRASSRDGFKAVKIFKYETTSFHKMFDYVYGDPRFYKPSRQRRPLIKLWARKEYANLKTAHAAGVAVPEPFACRDNVIIMEFLGVGGVQSALLNEVILEDPAATFKEIVENMRKTHQAGLVHADLSAYNIIIHDGKPRLIDWGQAVSLKHPRSREFLASDVRNVVKYFNRLGVNADEDKILETVMN